MSGILALLQIAVAWIILFGVFCGMGLFVTRFLDSRATGIESLLNVFWLGWAGSLGILQIWHLFAPVNGIALCALLFLAIGGLFRCSHSVRESFQQEFTLRRCLICTILVLWLANLAQAPLRTYDAGLYHLSAIRWISAYPIVPGIANLHDRLGFNSAYFLYQSVLDVGIWTQRSHHLASGLLLLVVLLEIGVSTAKIVSRRAAYTYDLMRILLLSPILNLCFLQASTTSPDLPVFLVGAIISIRLCRLTVCRRREFEKQDIMSIMVLSAIGIALKVSFIAMGLLASIVALALWLSRIIKNGFNAHLKWILGPIALTFCILFPWMVRNVLSTGYPLYPGPFFSFPVQWRLNPETLTNSNNWIKAWARNPNVPPNQVLTDWSWLYHWGKHILNEQRFPVLLPLSLFVLGLFILGFRGVSKGGFVSCFLFFIPALGMLLFWFFTAPDPRFAGATFWYLGAGAVALAVKRYATVVTQRESSLALLLSLAIALPVGLKDVRIVRPGPDAGFYPIPTVAVKRFITTSGLLLYTPENGDQCWDAHLMCVPYPDPQLRLIEKGEVRRGFAIAR